MTRPISGRHQTMSLQHTSENVRMPVTKTATKPVNFQEWVDIDSVVEFEWKRFTKIEQINNRDIPSQMSDAAPS